MSRLPQARRRRSLWGLFIAPILLLIAAVAWSAFWFFAASQVDVQADAWRAREAKAGRVYDCAKRSVAGFPFRLEVRCSDPTVALFSQAAGTPLMNAKLDEILVVAQVWDPKRIIAEFKGPAVIADGRGPASFNANWSVGQASVRGLPGPPQRADLVFEQPTIDRVEGNTAVPTARADHAELHGRLADGTPPDQPVLETALQIANGSIQGAHPLLAEPFNTDIQGRVTGLKDFRPKPWPERFREIQAAGGHVEIVQARIQQGELLAIAAGTLSLTANGNIDGEVQMTVAGIEKVIPALGLDKMLENGVPQGTLDRVAPGVKSQDVSNLLGALDRAIPGLGKVVKQNANVGVALGINALGKETTLEGRNARTFPLRFSDGVVVLGPFKVARVPPLF
ncbi:conserved hypothetical protein [Bradyrhizobium sp. ORS 285]|uniref:DUF2125 domain-containing protein n=1 Tax=Bradyrhizobium sp. ORS 285 TaxID=115808 RepID=UPI0002407F67|nr:DUF2125 domain-containing protein [Bradyrhizobium sp. ORS 285]CCD90303.1 conserved exported hypothetical protein [Bradyrhizobium sp. ORS 285]SMX61085.1 conserved hypothetical protein [Bradyrhizobium sp. ORS 285]